MKHIFLIINIIIFIFISLGDVYAAESDLTQPETVTVISSEDDTVKEAAASPDNITNGDILIFYGLMVVAGLLISMCIFRRF